MGIGKASSSPLCPVDISTQSHPRTSMARSMFSRCHLIHHLNVNLFPLRLTSQLPIPHPQITRPYCLPNVACSRHVVYGRMSDVSIMLVQDVLSTATYPFQTPFTCFQLRQVFTILCWVNTGWHGHSSKSCLCPQELKCLKMFYRGYDYLSLLPIWVICYQSRYCCLLTFTL